MSKNRINDLKVKAIQNLAKPLYRANNPFVSGLQHVSNKRPALYVCNHTSPFSIDVLILYMTLSQEAGISLTALAHRSAFKIPALARQLESLGVLEGNRTNCRRLMAEGKHILVFPGGSRELLKNKDRKYRLDWADRLGFVRMAVEQGYRIVPVAKIGGEDHFDIRLDTSDVMRSPLGPLLRKVHINEMLPLVSGWANTPMPRPERYYIRFMPSIDTVPYVGKEEDDATCMAIRQEVKVAIETAIEELKQVREGDPLRNVLQRLKQMPSDWWQRWYA